MTDWPTLPSNGNQRKHKAFEEKKRKRILKTPAVFYCACLCVKIVQRKSIWITSIVQFQLFVYCMYYLCICMYVVMRSVLRWELAYRITLCDCIMTIENLECWMTDVALISLHKSLLEYAEGVTISEEEHCLHLFQVQINIWLICFDSISTEYCKLQRVVTILCKLTLSNLNFPKENTKMVSHVCVFNETERRDYLRY